MARLRGPRRRCLDEMARGSTLQVVQTPYGERAFLVDDGKRYELVKWRHAAKVIEGGYVHRDSRTIETYSITSTGHDYLAFRSSSTARRELTLDLARA